MIFDIDNQTDYNPNINLLKSIALEFTKKDIELIICNNQYIQNINNTYRKIDKPTDVLSFPYDDMPNTPQGSIVISLDFVKQKAKIYDHSIDDEFALLFIHGLLHLLGYDHECDNGEQRELEKKLIKQYNLPKSLIVREEETICI